MFNLENVTCARKLSVSKCGTASLGYLKNRAATGDLYVLSSQWGCLADDLLGADPRGS